MDIIQNEIQKVEQKIATLRFELAVAEKVLEHLQAMKNPNHPTMSNRGRRRSHDGSVARHLESVLIEAGKALTIPEMTKALVESGVTSKSKYGLSAMIASSLNKRKDVFRRVRRGVYALKTQKKESAEIE